MRASGRRAGSPTGLWIALFALAGLVVADEFAADADGRGLTAIDPGRLAFSGPAPWLADSWERWAAQRLAGLGPVSARDPEGIGLLVREVAALPLVASVGEPRVLWPDGLDLPVELRQPVACIRDGEDFLPVAADGTVLPGRWPAPPDTPRGFLAVIGPLDGSLDGARPGDRLRLERHLDALSVAASQLAHLPPEASRVLGPAVIDATAGRRASVDEPGVRLRLEDRRLVWFGRPPSVDAPGELPAALKWRSLARAAALLRGDDPRDWDLVDVRWDRPGLRLREGADSTAAGAPGKR